MRLIDADSLKTVICLSVCSYTQPQLCTCGCAQILAVDNAPTIEAEPVRHGHWIEYPDCLAYDGAFSDDHIVCSVCKSVWSVLDNCTERFDYCPHCGAKLDEVKNDG